MAVALKESAKKSAELAERARQEMQRGQLQSAKTSLVKTEMSAAKHLKQITYLIERYTVVQEHYQQQERVVTADINNVLARERLVENEKSSAETRLNFERDDLQINQSDLRLAEKRLRDAEEKREKAESSKEVSTVVAITAAVGTILTLGLAAPVALPLAVGAVGGIVVYKAIEKSAKEDISKFCGRIASSEQKIREVESTISSLSATISQLKCKKSSYMLQRSRLQNEKGKIKELIVFLQDAQMYGNKYSLATEYAIQRTGLTNKMVTRVVARGYTLFDSNGTKRTLASFEEAWDAFEEMTEKGNSYSFVINFKCTRCSNQYQQFPHIRVGKLICANCHLAS